LTLDTIRMKRAKSVAVSSRYLVLQFNLELFPKMQCP
jgi:hypothetical protein